MMVRSEGRAEGKFTESTKDKIARSQGSQSFIAYTISKDENDFFMKLLYIQSDQHARILLASLAFCASRLLKFSKKKVCLNRLKML